MNPNSYKTKCSPTWCPGCGNFGIEWAIRQALAELEIPSHEVVVVFGIGCSGNMADNLKVYGFHALHGRALPVALGVKLANHKLKVLAVAGDGDAYAEGTNHLIHTSRYNPDITYIVCNNHSFSLTTGQASPTSRTGYVTKTTPWGEIKKPLNPLALSLVSGASFVARGFAAEPQHLKDLIKVGINHKGFAHIDVFQQCVTLNKVQTLEYFRERIYKLDEKNHDPHNRDLAMDKLEKDEKLPIGIFYQESRPTYESNFPQIEKEVLVGKELGKINLDDLIAHL